MAEYMASDGTRFTDEDIERWAAVEESGDGFSGKYLGPPVAGFPPPPGAGRPVSVGEEARPFTIRLDAPRRAKLEAQARDRKMTMSQLVRQLIDAL